MRGQPVAIPAPVGGLNAVDALAAMPPGDASVLTNLFPYADRVETRPGFSLFSTLSPLFTSGASDEEGWLALASYGSGNAADTLFALYRAKAAVSTPVLYLYSVSSTGVLTQVRDISGLVGTIFSIGEWTQFGAASGTNYLVWAMSKSSGGGGFTAQAFDGSSWSTLSITGVPLYTLGVHSHRNRLWFYNGAAATDYLKAWYLPTGSVSGTVAEFNLAPFVKKGGRIVAMRTWTLDGGDGGSDDLAVFFTNRGEAIVYSGTDPSSPATWTLQGVFDVGAPASFNPADAGSGSFAYCFLKDSFTLKYGADMLFLMQAGITSANKVLRPSGEAQDLTISRKINPLITDASKSWLTLAGANVRTPNMKMCFSPALKSLFISVPTAVATYGSSPIRYSITADLYVMNTQTGAWCKYTGFSVQDMIAIGSNVYFIDGSERIFKYDGTATSDNSTAITFECRQAYNYFGGPNNKHATLMQPMLRSTGNFSMTLQADADFNAGTISAYTSYTVGSTQNLQPWISASKYGRAFASHLQGQTSAGVVSWYATNYIVKSAGIV